MPCALQIAPSLGTLYLFSIYSSKWQSCNVSCTLANEVEKEKWVMKRAISMAMVLCLLSFSSGQAISHLQATEYSERILAYQQAAAKTHPRYLEKIDASKTRLKERIPVYAYGSFYGACPTDTLWAKTIIQNPTVMAEVYAENRVETDLRSPDVQIAFTLKDGEILFEGDVLLAQYKADPMQRSFIRMTDTTAGPRVAATTQLTTQGMALQATAGCTGCHS